MCLEYINVQQRGIEMFGHLCIFMHKCIFILGLGVFKLKNNGLNNCDFNETYVDLMKS